MTGSLSSWIGGVAPVQPRDLAEELARSLSVARRMAIAADLRGEQREAGRAA